MKKHGKLKKMTQVYEAPFIYTGAFYFLLVMWTAVSVFLLLSHKNVAGWPLGHLLMIAFVLAYTWYFSLGITYRIRVEANGSIQMTSFRRNIMFDAKGVEAVEGPRLPLLPFGFIRFRLEREKIYLFSIIADEALQKALIAIRNTNPGMKFKGF